MIFRSHRGTIENTLGDECVVMTHHELQVECERILGRPFDHREIHIDYYSPGVYIVSVDRYGMIGVMDGDFT